MQEQQTKGLRPQEFVAIASVLTSFGVRGEIKARILTDFPERFKKTKEVYLVQPSYFAKFAFSSKLYFVEA